jgi:hypothetical protein
MFDATPSTSSHALMQDRAFAAALRKCGEAPVTLPSGLTLLKRRVAGIPILMLPRVSPPADLRAQLAQVGQQRLPLILSPEQPCKMPLALRVSPARTLLQIDLSSPQKERRAALHQNWRHQLGQAENGPLRVLYRPLTPDHILLALERAQALSRRYQSWPVTLTAAFAKIAPDQTHLFTALLRGHPVAHMLFLSHGNRATYHIGHSTDAGRKSHAHNLLLWDAMNQLKQRGITSLDLGPTTTPNIDRFKRRAGAQPLTTGGTWLRWSPLARARRT